MSDTILNAAAAPLPASEAAPVAQPSAEPAKAAEPVQQAAQQQAKTEPAKPASTLLSDIADLGDGDDGKGFDWRAAMSRGDQKKLATLGRFADLGTLADAFFEVRTKLSQRDVSIPGAEAAPEEIAAYRAKLGIPDDPAGYEFKGEFSDGEKGAIGSLKAALHSVHAPPAVASAIAEWYSNEFAPAIQTERETFAKQFRAETRASLIEEMGPRDFERGVKLANQFVIDRLGKDGASEFLGAELTNGTRIGDNPAVLKLLMGLARDYAGDDLVAAVEAPDAKSVDAKIDEIMSWMKTDTARYNRPDTQAELLRLTQIQETRAARRAA
jgi:hypothetical protein